ncbi:MAG: hypothetical protein K1X53_07895 [Candidatus Sumerlaeaceae bacterium]|nr:hypothetical protein [Candidatus Sumerlaeaceae bacterium]
MSTSCAYFAMLPGLLRVLLLVCLLLVWHREAGAQAEIDNRELLRINVSEPAQVDSLAKQGLDLWSVDSHSVRAYVSSSEMKWLLENGFSFTSEQEALKRALINPAATNGFYTFAEFETAMFGWASAHPGIVSLTSLGKSVENRDIWLLKISDNVATDENEPNVVFLGLQHAREWLSGMTVHGIVDKIINSYGTDAEITNFVNSMQIYVILVCNPDGYVYTHTTTRLWRKNRRNNGDGTYGVDLNRNLPYAWTSGGASSSDTYGGTAPLSEPENVALASFLNSRRIHGLINYHTYGGLVMYNWAYTNTPPSNAVPMGDLAYAIAQAIEAVNGQRMRNGTWSGTLEYTGGGTTMDYVHGSLGIPTISIELRPADEDPGGFAPTSALIAPSIAEVFEGTKVYLNWVLNHAADPTPPQLSNFQVTKISNTQATLTWNSDDMSTRAVEFGSTTGYGTKVSPDQLRDMQHLVTLTGLTANTTYHFRVGSSNLAGTETWTTDTTFKTTAAAMDITAPEYPFLRLIRRSAPGTMELTWAKLDSSPLAGYRLYESTDGTTWTIAADETMLGPTLTNKTLPAPPVGEIRLYRMTAVDSSPYKNESKPSDTYALGMGAQPAKYLVVDGFDRWNNLNVSAGKNHAFAGDHGAAIHAAGRPFDTCANNAIGVEANLLNYKYVIWVLGSESTTNETFSTAEQALVSAFLQAGGCLFVSGSEIGWDLDQNGSAADKAFYNQYLCAGYVQDDFNKFTVFGTGGDSLFGSALFQFDDGSRRIYRVGAPDRITPLNGAASALITSAGESAAVWRYGVFGISGTPGKLVMLSFPFETVHPSTSRDALMAGVIKYFETPIYTSATDWQAYDPIDVR